MRFPEHCSRLRSSYIISRLTTIVFIIAVLDKNAQAERMGPNSQYECNCVEEKCINVTGSCEAGSTCADGFFGVACQYVNLCVGHVLENPVLNDQNTSTCYDGAENEVYLKIDPSRFTFLRIAFKDSTYLTLLHGLQIKLFRTDALVPCTKWSSVPYENDQIEFHCPSNYEEVDKVVITGDELLPLLCEVYISGGRNVALYKETNLTSHSGEDFLSRYAVDGTYGNGFKGKECIQSAPGDVAPTFEVTFEHPYSIDYFIIRNRPTDGLVKFILSTENEENIEVSKYTDVNSDPQPLYKIRHDQTFKIKQIKLKLHTGASQLSFCEFEAYGDCPPGSQGLHCDEKCNPGCAKDECTINGKCVECGNAKYGDNCDSDCPSSCTPSTNNGATCDRISRFCLNPCTSGMYGSTCSIACSSYCGGDGACDFNSGACTHGCQPGHSGEKCSADGAADETWHDKEDTPDQGGKADEECSPNCGGEGACDKISGACSQGCKHGFHGAMCRDANPDGGVGIACSPHCGGDGSCDDKTSACVHGCKPGFTGITCGETYIGPGNGTGDVSNESCPVGTYGANCAKECSIKCGGKKTCDSQTGQCDDRCMPGYGGANCTTDCSYCIESICDREALTCPKGCKEGAKNALCAEPIIQDVVEDLEDLGATSYIAFLFVGLACVLCCVLFVFLRKEKPKDLVPE